MLQQNKTTFIGHKEVKKQWFIIDATNLIVGRLASQISIILKGKHRPEYTPHTDCGDNVVVINCTKIKFSGSKLNNKIYYKHTGYPGGIKSTTPIKIINKGFSSRILKLAVKRMLGKGPMGKQRLSNLYLYNDANHLQESQQPIPLQIELINSKNKLGT